ncbi:MAG: enoyl-CoA hydratase [Bacillaceae bacterium]
MGFLTFNVQDKIATITIQNPPANAMSAAVFSELKAALVELEKDESVAVVVVHGEGRFFSAGADIKEFLLLESGEHAQAMSTNGQDLFEWVENYPKPIIAAIHGAALGGGLEFAMACHMRVATENAKLGLPELNLGLIPGYGGTQRLTRLVGKAKALEMMLLSEPITGVQAEKLGLVNVAVPEEELLTYVNALAKKISLKSPITVRAVLKVANSVKTKEFYEGLNEEAVFFGKAFASADGKEGVTAFVDKRKPVFTGK